MVHYNLDIQVEVTQNIDENYENLVAEDLYDNMPKMGIIKVIAQGIEVANGIIGGLVFS